MVEYPEIENIFTVSGALVLVLFFIHHMMKKSMGMEDNEDDEDL